LGEDVEVLPKEKQVPFSECLQLVLVLCFKEEKPPPHLYFYVEANRLHGDSNQQKFLALFDWPFKLLFCVVVYTLCVRGYWGGEHYWCKLLKSVGRMAGVWMHNDLVNQGNAQLISTVLGSIGGKEASTSYVMYSQRWNDEEEKLINTSVKKIAAQHPNAEGFVPFEGMKSLLCGPANAPNNTEQNKINENNIEHTKKKVEANSDSKNNHNQDSESENNHNQDSDSENDHDKDSESENDHNQDSDSKNNHNQNYEPLLSDDDFENKPASNSSEKRALTKDTFVESGAPLAETENLKEVEPSKLKFKIRLNPVLSNTEARKPVASNPESSKPVASDPEASNPVASRGRGRGRGQASSATRKSVRNLGGEKN
jgi:hypothetical protein